MGLKVQLTTAHGKYTKKVPGGKTPAEVAAKLIATYAQGKPYETELKVAA